VDMAGIGYEFRTRVNALQALRRLNACPDTLFPALFGAMTYFNGRLRGPAQEVGKYFMQQTSVHDRLVAYYRSRSWTAEEGNFLKSVMD
jgi:hypothetical protein